MGTTDRSGFLDGVMKSLESYQPDDLRQYGVPGMRWGHRKPHGAPPGPASEVTIKATPGKKIKTSGGKEVPASDDAIKARVGRQVAKKSTTDALSNAELQAVVNRMQLEASFRRLSTEDKTAGERFIQRFFFNQKAREKDLANIESLYGAGATAVTAAKVGRDIKNMKL